MLLSMFYLLHILLYLLCFPLFLFRDSSLLIIYTSCSLSCTNSISLCCCFITCSKLFTFVLSFSYSNFSNPSLDCTVDLSKSI